MIAALKLIPDWFVTSKMIEKLHTTLDPDENLFYFNEDSGDATFCCDKMGVISVNPNNINIDINFDEYDSHTFILIRLLAWHVKFEKHKVLKKR